MGCSETIFVDETTIDFPIFLLFFEYKVSYFSYFLNPEFPIFLSNHAAGYPAGATISIKLHSSSSLSLCNFQLLFIMW